MLVSLTDWAATHGYTGSAARNLIRRGKLPEAKKIGRNWVIDSEVSWPVDRRRFRGSCSDCAKK